MEGNGNGYGPKVKGVAVIQIVLGDDGQVHASFNAAQPSRLLFNGMMESAKQNILGQIIAAEAAAAKKVTGDIPAELAARNLRT